MEKVSRPVPVPAPDAEDVLSLALSRSEDGRARFRALTPEQLAGAAVALKPRQRAELLELVERPEEVVPLLPEAAFTSTVRATGIEDAGWLVGCASPEQRVAAVDLDCWKDHRLSPRRLFEWIDALIEAGPETLVAAFDELDPELWVLAMKEMADFSVADGEDPELQPDDGFFIYEPHSAEHEERVHEILRTALVYSPRHYWNFVYGAMFESRRECEQFAAGWQRDRLSELGFPDREQAMRAYRPLRAEAVPVPRDGQGGAGTHALVATPRPPARLGGSLVGQALGELPPDRAQEVLGRVLAVANALAVADELPLGEPESVSGSLQKALRGIERGLTELAKTRDRSPSAVLEKVEPLDLFRIGAGLEPGLRPRKSLASLLLTEERDDWDVATEVIAPEDRTVGEDGRLGS